MTDLPPVERIRALKVEPGDTLIVSLPEYVELSTEIIETWRQLFREALGDVSVLFTQGDIEFEVVTS